MSISNNYSSGEIPASQYYIHNSYVNSYYHMYKYLESWLVKNLFRNDKSRVFLASDEYCFRRRFELTDTSQNYNDLEFSALRFPFANYFPLNTGWKADTRYAANPASLVYDGIYIGNTKVRAASGIMDIPVTIWFDREDDARFAYDRLYFYSFNEHNDSVKVSYGRDYTLDYDGGSNSTAILGLPMVLSIKGLDFNPQFKENDWLKKQRVFVIKATMEMRTYAIYPPEQPNYDLRMEENGILSDGSTYEDGINFYYIVDDVILSLRNNDDTRVEVYDAGYNPIDGTFSGTKAFPEVGEYRVIYIDSHFEDEEVVNTESPHIYSEPSSMKRNLYVWDYVNEKYIEPDYSVDCHAIRYNGTYDESHLDIAKCDYITKVTPFSNTIEWEYGSEETAESIESIEIHMANIDKIIYLDASETSYTFNDLKSNSQYYGYILFVSKNGDSKKIMINFVTPMSREDELKKKGTKNSLVGITW